MPILDASAPYSVNTIYTNAYDANRHHGHVEAHKRGVRHVQIAGWYKHKNGWKQVHDDLTKKVTIRDAIMQPDGKFLIPDVPVFYANHVKNNLPINPDKVRQLIKNTNDSINKYGSQKPGVCEGHPNPDESLLGTQSNVHGSAVDWKEDKERPGWARCTLIDVPKEYVDRIRERKLTGMSAGLARDNAGLGARFGHVALLGATSQALMHLPTTELFSASSTINFSADETYLPITRKQMKIEKRHMDCYKALHDAFAAYSAAEGCVKTSEPESQEKLGEAAGNVFAAHKAMRECFESEPGNSPGPTNGANADELGKSAPGMAMQPLSDVASEPSGDEYAVTESPLFRADPELAFAQYASKVERLDKMNRVLELKVRAAENKEKFAHFSATAETLRKEGRLMPDATIIRGDFDQCFSSRDPDAAISHRLAAYRAIPAQRTPATVHAAQPIFDANSSNKPTPTKSAKGNVKATAVEDFLMEQVTPEQMIWANIGNDSFAAGRAD